MGGIMALMTKAGYTWSLNGRSGLGDPKRERQILPEHCRSCLSRPTQVTLSVLLIGDTVHMIWRITLLLLHWYIHVSQTHEMHFRRYSFARLWQCECMLCIYHHRRQQMRTGSIVCVWMADLQSGIYRVVIRTHYSLFWSHTSHTPCTTHAHTIHTPMYTTHWIHIHQCTHIRMHMYSVNVRWKGLANTMPSLTCASLHFNSSIHPPPSSHSLCSNLGEQSWSLVSSVTTLHLCVSSMTRSVHMWVAISMWSLH